jgi:2-polyprenyl-6-methoxyphenol hydroxylase-like FAD-dependent oxidoreductase
MLTAHDLKSTGTIAIVGAGPAGATLARLLLDQGFLVNIYESDASIDSRPQGGSLDLRADSGRRAIDRAGLGSTFERESRSEARAFRMMNSDGKELPGAGDETHENAGPEIDRGDLRRMLINSLPAGTINWDHKVDAVDRLEGGKWCLSFAGQASIEADFVVGADGVGSKVRQRLTDIAPIYTGITMVAANIREDLWRGSALDEVLGEGSIMYAGGNKTIFVQRCAHDLILVYFSMAVPRDWPKSAGFTLSDKMTLMKSISEAYGDWDPETLSPDFTWPAVQGLTMIGDAAHVMPPFTGKGVNLALLDALELAEAFASASGSNVTDAVARFERQMQQRSVNEIRACMQVGQQMYGIDLGFNLGDDA